MACFALLHTKNLCLLAFVNNLFKFIVTAFFCFNVFPVSAAGSALRTDLDVLIEGQGQGSVDHLRMIDAMFGRQLTVQVEQLVAQLGMQMQGMKIGDGVAEIISYSRSFIVSCSSEGVFRVDLLIVSATLERL